MNRIHAGVMLATVFGCAAIIHAGPLPACASQFDYSCASATLGGYTVITPLSATGSTEITGFNSSNAIVFDQTIPAPPTGAPGSEVQNAVFFADAQLAAQSGQASTLPACASTPVLCIASNPGTPTVITSLVTASYVAQDTALTQTVNQFSTTLIATLNGNQVFSETFGAPFSDPSVQAAVLFADGLLTGDGATFGVPSLASSSTSPLSSQVSYEQTGRQATGMDGVTTTDTFGPVVIIGCFSQCPFGDITGSLPDLTVFPGGQLDINVSTDIQFAIDRTVTTTNTFLTTQTYEIEGTIPTNEVPEPSTWGLVLASAGAIAMRRLWRSR